VVLINGGPLSIAWIKNNVPSVLEAFYPGELGGEAIVDVLSGSYNPSGRLPVTVYPSEFVQRSIFNMDLRDDGGVTYQWYDNKFGQPLWQFGHGLSYTRWHFTAPATESTAPIALSTAVLAESLGDSSHPTFSVNVRNEGARDGSVSVLGFVMNEIGQVTAKLFGFKKLFIKAGESAAVHLVASPLAFARADHDGVLSIHPGNYTIHMGGAIGDGIRTAVTLSGTPKVLSSEMNLKPNHHSPHTFVMDAVAGPTIV